MVDQLTEKAVSMTDDRGELVSLVACLGNAIQAEPETFYERPLQAWPEWISEQGFDSQCLINWVNAAAQTSSLSTAQLHQFYAEQAKSGVTTASFLAQLHEQSPQFVEALRASMQELGEEAESLQQVAGGTSALKGHPGANTAIGVLAGTAFFLGVDHFLNKGRVRKYVFGTYKGTGEAGNIAQDGEQVVLRDDQRLLEEVVMKNSNAIENNSLVERQERNLIIRPEQEAQADAARAVAVKKNPDLLIEEANKALSPEEMNKFLTKLAQNNLVDLEKATWKEIEAQFDLSDIRKVLNESAKKLEASIKDLDAKISELLVKVDRDLDGSPSRAIRAYKLDNGSWDYSGIKTQFDLWGREYPAEKAQALDAFNGLNRARIQEQTLVDRASAKGAEMQYAYREYWKGILQDNTILKNELEIKAAEDAGGAAANHIDKELNQAISAEAVSMADNAMEKGDVQIINVAEKDVDKILVDETKEVVDELGEEVDNEVDEIVEELMP